MILIQEYTSLVGRRYSYLFAFAKDQGAAKNEYYEGTDSLIIKDLK